MSEWFTITENAENHIFDLMKQQGITTESHVLRVGIKGGGCSGLKYVLDFDDSPIIESDTIVEGSKGLKVVTDMKSLLYLFGTELNYSDGLDGRGFEFVNPNASRTCGCGESFAV